MTLREILDSLGPHSRASDAAPLLDHAEADETHVLALLRKRDLATPVIEAVARHDRWNKRHVVRGAIVRHMKTPRTLALRMLSLLFWREQLRVATNIRLAMPLRVAAESRLKKRLPELELGEQISIAHSAPPGLIPALAACNHERVVQSLLRNPRMREQDVLTLVKRETTTGSVLRAVAQSERWVVRPLVRTAIVSHRNTPVHVALTLLSRMPRRTLTALLKNNELRPVIAIRARKILSGEKIASPR
ncbi:MAG: hypothetical protein BMS9Abin37_0615 [Acidobacteriota bacterium]|nr:MAG: hypothetical protein BMS9Abin37_0615 [Acidobacteriota bacterium]